MTDDLDDAIAHVADARRMESTARAVARAADEARVTAIRNREDAEHKLHGKLNARIEAHPEHAR